MRSGVGWEEDESIGWELKKVRKYFSANIKPANTASGGVVKKSPWVWAIVSKRNENELFTCWVSDSDVTLMAILCCCLMFSRLETIYREKLWEHFRTNDHDRSCGTLNIKSNRANIPSVCWNSPWILIAIPLFFSQSKTQENCWKKFLKKPRAAMVDMSWMINFSP